jgi:hypothetical protein
MFDQHYMMGIFHFMLQISIRAQVSGDSHPGNMICMIWRNAPIKSNKVHFNLVGSGFQIEGRAAETKNLSLYHTDELSANLNEIRLSNHLLDNCYVPFLE